MSPICRTKRTLCDHNFSEKAKLKIHVKSVHANQKPCKCLTCDYSCSIKGYLKRHVPSVHENQRPHKCSSCNYCSSQKGDLKNILSQYMKVGSHINAQYVNTAPHKLWKDILNLFMRIRNNTNVSFVKKASQRRTTWKNTWNCFMKENKEHKNVSKNFNISLKPSDLITLTMLPECILRH